MKLKNKHAESFIQSFIHKNTNKNTRSKYRDKEWPLNEILGKLFPDQDMTIVSKNKKEALKLTDFFIPNDGSVDFR